MIEWDYFIEWDGQMLLMLSKYNIQSCFHARTYLYLEQWQFVTFILILYENTLALGDGNIVDNWEISSSESL